MATTALMTGAQFDALPYDEGRLWELVDGELIPAPSPTIKHQGVVQTIQVAFVVHFAANPEQGSSFSDVEFALSENHRVRPDVFVLLHEHLQVVDQDKVPIPGAPDIAIEVISPSERSIDSQLKVEAYLRYGTQEVWQVFPKTQSVVIHRGVNGTKLSGSEDITTPLLPGFSLPVQSLFQSGIL
jgi:Uma2 family endonuclease